MRQVTDSGNEVVVPVGIQFRHDSPQLGPEGGEGLDIPRSPSVRSENDGGPFKKIRRGVIQAFFFRTRHRVRAEELPSPRPYHRCDLANDWPLDAAHVGHEHLAALDRGKVSHLLDGGSHVPRGHGENNAIRPGDGLAHLRGGEIDQSGSRPQGGDTLGAARPSC